MKVTKQFIRKIIKEELGSVLNEENNFSSLKQLVDDGEATYSDDPKGGFIENEFTEFSDSPNVWVLDAYGNKWKAVKKNGVLTQLGQKLGLG